MQSETPDAAPTFGIEEEFFLLDPERGLPVPAAADVLSRLSATGGAGAKNEFLASQIEFATPVCGSASEAFAALRGFRRDLARVAGELGILAAPMGTPFDAEGTPAIVDAERYDEIASLHASLLSDHQVAALHVHVAVPDAEAGIRALNALRGWLPLLRALFADSPWWRGADTGFASWRGVLLRRWTTGGCPPHLRDAAEYRRRVGALVGVGGTRDEATVAWDIRLSVRYPTVEVRVADAQLSAVDSVLLALLCRGVVAASATGAQAPRPDTELVDAALWHSARFGVERGVLDPVTSTLVPVRDAVDRLRAALVLDAADRELVDAGLDRILREGSGATRQRRAFAEAGWGGVRELVTAALTA